MTIFFEFKTIKNHIIFLLALQENDKSDHNFRLNPDAIRAQKKYKHKNIIQQIMRIDKFVNSQKKDIVTHENVVTYLEDEASTKQIKNTIQAKINIRTPKLLII